MLINKNRVELEKEKGINKIERFFAYAQNDSNKTKKEQAFTCSSMADLVRKFMQLQLLCSSS